MPTHLFSKQKIHANRKVCMDSTFSIGGDKRDRTADLLNAIQALSQLSYNPMREEAFSEPRNESQPFFSWPRQKQSPKPSLKGTPSSPPFLRNVFPSQTAPLPKN